jgi:hypothetical protein
MLPGNCTLDILLLKILTSLVLVAVYALCRPLTEQSSILGTSSVGVFEEVNTYLVSVLLLAHVKANLQLLDKRWVKLTVLLESMIKGILELIGYGVYVGREQFAHLYVYFILCKMWKEMETFILTFMYHVEPVIETYHYPCIPFFIDSLRNF